MTLNASAAYKAPLFCLLLFLTGRVIAGAQETPLEEIPGLRERAVVMNIIARIVEENEEVVWDSENRRVTIPGRPVGIKLLGSDLVVAVQFTPFLHSSGQHVLVAQGQIWINIPDEGISYHTTMQTIPVQFREQVYFFPLGSMKTQDEAQIEIQLVMEPFFEQRPSEPQRTESPRNGRPAEPQRQRGRVVPP